MADRLTVEEGQVTVTTEEGTTIQRPESDLRKMVQQQVLPPLNGAAFPDGLKFYRWQPPVLVVVHQTPPHVRQLRWIEDDSPQDFGPGTQYRLVRLSLPYAITFAVYHQCGPHLMLAGSNELYFRNEPLRNTTDSLGFPALLNISCIRRPNRTVSWICTQHLRTTPDMDWCQQLEALLEHTWCGAFNRSSERHEGKSMYGFSQGVHKDLHPISRWCEATEANEAFALSVPWKPVPQNVGELMESIVQEQQAAGARIFAFAELPFLRRPTAEPASLVAQFINYTQTTSNQE